MSYRDGRDFEPEYVATIEDSTVEIAKLGGGTPGKLYHGLWGVKIDGEWLG